MGDMTSLMQTQVQTNNLTAFKDYIEENEETFHGVRQRDHL